jgi:LuxR family maltose regulon positive regulatory protein
MPSPLLITKLHIPRARSAQVLRPRLVARLQQGLSRPLTLVSAPAGFGKTTLLCEWLQNCGQPFAWVSLDQGDNDPARFWAYFIAALQTVDPHLGQSWPDLVSLPTLPPVEALLTELINELAGQSQAFILVLDDYHVIAAQAIHAGLLFLLDHAPTQLHLVLASRADPPWPLARLRARDQLVELRAADLRFTPPEAAEFFSHTVQLELTPEDITALEERTEGWITGLQMVALSLQGRSDGHSFITAFTGSHRLIFDYLVEEVLQRQSLELQEFLLKTSLLERLNTRLCDAILGQNHSQEILAQLDRANLFIVPLDDERCWYRYHHLFATLLRSRLEQTWKAAVPGLNRAASAWCERAGLIEEAVSYAQASTDLPYLLDLLERNVLKTMALGEFSLARRWLGNLPDAEIQSRAILCVAQGWLTPLTDPVSRQRATQWMNAAESALNRVDSVRPSTKSNVECNLAVFRVMVARFQGQPAQEVIQLGLQVLDFVASQSAQLHSLLLLQLGGCYLEMGDFQAANRIFDQVLQVGMASQNYNAAFAAINTRLMLAYVRAEFSEALRIGQESRIVVLQPLEQAGHRPPDSAATYMVSGMIRLERNDLAGAREDLTTAMALYPKLQPGVSLARCYLAMARVLYALGDLANIPDLSRLAYTHLPEFARLFAPYQSEIELLRAQQDRKYLAQAVDWAHRFQAGLDRSSVTHAEALALAQVRLAQRQAGYGPIQRSDWQFILALLAEKLEEAREQSLNLYILQIQIQRARVLHGSGQPAEASAALVEALRLAEPEGIVRPFLDEGDALQGLLVDLYGSIERANPSGHANPLLRFIDSLLTGSTGVPHPAGIEPLIQPLSERELEILRLLNTSLNSPEIAARLYISVSTVRTHIKNIYAKLNVNRRIEATQRAADLGLI